MARISTRLRWAVSGAVALLVAGGPAEASPPSPCPQAGRLIAIGSQCFCDDIGRLRRVETTSFCLSCHDGTVAPSAAGRCQAGRATAYGVLNNGGAEHGMGYHPIDFAYPKSAPGFHRAEIVRKRVLLLDGKVTCVTCHSGEAGIASYMERPREPVALCVCCHFR